MVEELGALPGVGEVGLSQTWARYSRTVQRTEDIFTAGITTPILRAFSDRATPGFFASLGVPLQRGRDFTWDDLPGRPAVAIVTARVAKALVPTGDVLGRRITVGEGSAEVEIVGVVADFLPTDVRIADSAFVFQPLAQLPAATSLPVVTVRATGPVNLNELGRIVAAGGREYVLGALPLAERMDRQLLRERLMAGLGRWAAGLALAIAATGLWSLLAFLVAARTREFGVRLALGASPRSLWAGVARDGLVLGAIGLGFGIPLAAVAGRLIGGVLIGVSRLDATSFLLAGLVLLCTAALAGVQPARRAAGVDPLTALRSE
jgi:hypothetical protein